MSQDSVIFLLNDPLWLLIIIPFISILVWELRQRRLRGTIQLTDLEFLRQHAGLAGRRRRRFRAFLWGVLVVGIVLLWSGPVLRTTAPLFQGGEQIVYQKFLLMLDISRSMSTPLGAEETVSLPGQPAVRSGPEEEEMQRFLAARAALMDFVKRFPSAQIGLILFSAEPILARWPTVETQNLFWEVLEERIGRGVNSQLQSFSSLTNTDKALTLAREMFAQQQVNEGAVILISDAEDDIENMGLSVRNLRLDGIRVYVIGVGIAEQIAANLSQQFSHDMGFRIFHVDSEEEMQEAYRLVAEVEESLPFELNRQAYLNDLRWILAAMLMVISCVLLWVMEKSFHYSPTAGRV